MHPSKLPLATRTAPYQQAPLQHGVLTSGSGEKSPKKPPEKNSAPINPNKKDQAGGGSGLSPKDFERLKRKHNEFLKNYPTIRPPDPEKK